MTQQKLSELEKLKARRAVINARIQAEEAKAKTKQRKLDTRRQILIGAYFIEQYQQKGKLTELYNLMRKHLTREADQGLFSHPEKEEQG